MNQETRAARHRLRSATREEFESMVYMAMLTPAQEKVLRLHICKGVSVQWIAELLGYSDSGIRKMLARAYEKVAKLQ